MQYTPTRKTGFPHTAYRISGVYRNKSQMTTGKKRVKRVNMLLTNPGFWTRHVPVLVGWLKQQGSVYDYGLYLRVRWQRRIAECCQSWSIGQQSLRLQSSDFAMKPGWWTWVNCSVGGEGGFQHLI